MSSPVEICNMALSHLGVGKEIASLTENSQEAKACRRFYENSRDDTLRAFDWSFATAFIALGLVEEDPTTEWAFSYRQPSDCIKIRRILSGERNDTQESKTPFKISSDTSGILILTDMEEATTEYTKRTEAVEHYPSDFIQAMSFKLAVLIAPRLTAGDRFKMGARAASLFVKAISDAQGNSLNEEQPDQPPDSEFITARN